jgi:hypothetical protein
MPIRARWSEEQIYALCIFPLELTTRHLAARALRPDAAENSVYVLWSLSGVGFLVGEFHFRVDLVENKKRN